MNRPDTLNRLGLLLSAPAGRSAASLVLILLTLAASISLPQLRFDEHQEDLFRTDAGRYSRYLEYVERFPAEQHEVSILIEGDLFTPEALTTLQHLQSRLNRLNPVDHVLSIFAIPQLEKLFTQARAGDPDAKSILSQKLAQPEYWPGRLVSENERVLVLIVSLTTAEARDAKTIKHKLLELESTLQDVLKNSKLTSHVTGFPALRIALRDQIKQDTLMFSGLALLFATLVACIYFRSAVVVAASLVGPSAAVLWMFGALAISGTSINVLTQMVGVLILVVSYSDALHLTQHIRQQHHQGASSGQIISSAFKDVIPACWLTSLTSAAGFISLTLSKSPNIQLFGLVCALGTLFGFLAVMLSVPLMTWLCTRQTHKAGVTPACTGALRVPVRWDRLVLITGISSTVAVLVSATQLHPDYSFAENLSADNPARHALNIADQELGGQLPLHVMLQWSNANSDSLSARIGLIRSVQEQLNAGTGEDWISLSDLLLLTPGFGVNSKVRQLPPYAVAHFLNTEFDAALISTNVTSAGAREVERIEQLAEPVLAEARLANPGVRIEIAGFLSLVSHGSRHMIADLGRSLFAAAAIIFVINVLLFRSFALGLVSFIPNIAPIASVAAVLVWTGEPLRYSSVVLFSICLGLAVDDTVHFIMRFRKYQRAGCSAAEATGRAQIEVGSVLVLTTLVMCAGFCALLFSTTPAVITMSVLACVALLVALVYDLCLLPALLRWRYG